MPPLPLSTPQVMYSGVTYTASTDFSTFWLPGNAVYFKAGVYTQASSLAAAPTCSSTEHVGTGTGQVTICSLVASHL